jgi:hypothetical protein
MYLPIKPTDTCPAGWLSAAREVNASPGHEAHNVIIDMAEPMSESAADRHVILLADEFLR